MEKGPEKFILTDEGDIDKFLGVEIVDRGKGEFEMKQPHLIDHRTNSSSTRPQG